MGDDQIKIPTGRFDDIHDREQYIQAAIKSIVVLNNKFTETNNNINELGKNIKFTAGEIALFKQAVCAMIDKTNKSSNKMLLASILYFIGSLLLTCLLVYVGFTQGRIMHENVKIMKDQTAMQEKQVEAINKQSSVIEKQTAVIKEQVEIMKMQYNQNAGPGEVKIVN